MAHGLSKSYRGRRVVDDVSFQLGPGEVAGLLGPNGAGKTTSFYMIVGLVAADSGRIELAGRDITGLPIHRRARLGLGYLPQEPSVFRRLNVRDNVLAILETRPHRKRRERHRQAEALLHELHIGHLADSPAVSLSGGERRRLEIARALAAEPRFMLLDEPFAGVDPISVADIRRIIELLCERGIGVLITDHNVRETLGICHAAYILNNGTVIATGTPEHVMEDPTVREVYLGEHFRM